MAKPPQLPLTPPEYKERVGTTMRLPVALKRELDDLAASRGISLSSVCIEFLMWALSEWKEAQKNTL